MAPLTPVHSQNRRTSHIALCAVLLCAALVSAACLYLPFRSCSLDDFDSYSFALALRHFDLTLQQPQPPGFPVYVFLARAFLWLADERAALTLLSALSGIAYAGLLFALGRRLTRHTSGGVLVALCGMLAPVAWLAAAKALSDMPGMVGILAVALLWWDDADSPVASPWRNRLVWGALLAGLTLGIRPQNALPLLWIGLRRVLVAFRRRESPALWLTAAAAGAIGLALWLIPTAALTGGLPRYVTLIQEHARHVGRADSLFGMGLPLAAALRARLAAFGATLALAMLGLDAFSASGAALSVAAFLGLGGLGIGILAADWRSATPRWLALWGVTVLLQIFGFEALDRPRLLLPLLPPFLLWSACGWTRLPRLWRIPAALFPCGLLLTTYPLAATLAQVPAPPAQATAYIAAHYPAAETLLAAAGSFRAAQVELPDYRLAYLYRLDAAQVSAALATAPRYVVILDRDQFPADALDVLSAAGQYVPLDERTFTRDRRVHTQHDRVRMQVLTPAALVPADALRLPADGCIDLGGDAAGRYLGAGWFRPESIGGASGRWAGETPTTTLRLALTAPAYRLRWRALAYPPDQAVSFYVSGPSADAPVFVGRAVLLQGWVEGEVRLADYPAGVITLSLVHARLRSPFETDGSADTRALAAAYDWICLTVP